MADPAKCIRGGANFEICSQLSESGICFSKRGGGAPGRPFIDPPLLHVHFLSAHTSTRYNIIYYSFTVCRRIYQLNNFSTFDNDNYLLFKYSCKGSSTNTLHDQRRK